MAEPGLSAAKAVLLAVQLARKADVSGLRTLVSKYPKALGVEIVLRILLSYLPETLDSTLYVPLLEDLASGNIAENPKATIDSTAVSEISNAEATKKVKKLHLLPLAWPQAPPDIPEDLFVLFLIHRSLRIDKNTGLIVQLPGLLVPFLSRSTYLRAWTISTVLPLVRFNYEYHPYDGTTLRIPEFEDLDDRAGVALLLSKSGKDTAMEVDDQKAIGRDIRGLIGPWMYGDTRSKRQKLQMAPFSNAGIVAPLDTPVEEHYKRTGWEEVFRWIASQAMISWPNAVGAIEQWDGPSDVDLGGYEDGSVWLDDEEQQHLERQYARAALAAAYLVPEASAEALTGVNRILARLVTLLDLERLPPLPAAAAFLTPVPSLEESGILALENAKYLRNNLLDDENPLTHPKEQAIRLLHALLISAYILTKAGLKFSVRKVGELLLFQDEHQQIVEFKRMIHAFERGPKADDNYWIRIRNEVLWLHDWGLEKPEEGAAAVRGRGIFGLVKRDFLEVEVLKVFLENTRYSLARSIYIDISSPPLSRKQLQDTIIAAAMNAYDNASNPNKTRGGLKRCHEIIKAFPDTFQGCDAAKRVEHLIEVTNELGKFSLVLTKGIPFKPVNLRVHGDPISIIEKILSQNHRSCTRLEEFLRLGDGMVDAGLTLQDVEGHALLPPPETNEEEAVKAVQTMEQEIDDRKSIARKRILGMCIVAALTEDDFETAYSYVVTRLKDIASPAQEAVPVLEHNTPGLFAEPPPRNIDEWSWLAAFQTGKYVRNGKAAAPTHLGNASGNLQIRHLEQRIDCLAYALRLAPKSTLQEVLSVYRRCEEELASLVRLEAEQEAAWDEQADEQAMPGGFGETPVRKQKISKAKTWDFKEEAPMSLFDLSRTTVARAQSSLSSLTMLQGRAVGQNRTSRPGTSGDGAHDSGASTPDVAGNLRKRDKLKNAAVDTMANGIGWLIGAQPVRNTQDDIDYNAEE